MTEVLRAGKFKEERNPEWLEQSKREQEINPRCTQFQAVRGFVRP
jgi:hypothetical protein